MFLTAPNRIVVLYMYVPKINRHKSIVHDFPRQIFPKVILPKPFTKFNSCHNLSPDSGEMGGVAFFTNYANPDRVRRHREHSYRSSLGLYLREYIHYLEFRFI